MVHPLDAHARSRVYAAALERVASRRWEDARVSCPRGGRPSFFRNYRRSHMSRRAARVLRQDESHLRIVPCRGQARRSGREAPPRRSRRDPRLLPATRGAAPRVAPVTVVPRHRALDRGPSSRRPTVRLSPATSGRGPRGQGDPGAPRSRSSARPSPAGARPAPSAAAPQAWSGLVARLYRGAVPASIGRTEPAEREPSAGS